MASFSSLIAVACFISLAISFIDMICPEKKFDKQLKVIFSLVFVIAVMNPFIKGDINFDFPEFDMVSADISFKEETYTDEVIKQIEKNIEEGLKTELMEKEIDTEKILVTVNISDNNSISITKVIFYTETSEKEEEIRTEIRKILGNETEIIRGQ